MYATLIAQIGTILNNIPSVALVSSTPRTDVNLFPYVYYYPSGYSNRFETQTQNYKVFRFTLLVYVGTAGTTVDAAFGTVLPNVVDDIIAAFDANWNGGVTPAGSRITVNVDSADNWDVLEEQDGGVCVAPLNVEIKMLTGV